jgi:glycosyltransferase involved in cell wall biosynthesis
MKISVAVRTKFHAFQLAQQLHERGMLHQLYTSFYGSFLNKDNSKGFTIPKRQVKTNLFTAFLFYQLHTENLAAFRFFGHWVANQLKDEQAIVTFPMIAFPILQRAKKLQIKTFITQGSAHDLVHYQLLKNGYQAANLPTKTLDNIFNAQRLEQTTLEYEMADYIQVPSKFVANSFIEQGISEKKLLYAPFGVDLRLFQRKEIVLPKVFRLIYIGNLSVLKGVHLLLEAFAKLKLPQAELYLIGNFSKEIKPFCAKYAQKNIHYINPLPQATLNEYLSKSSVFTINSLQDGFPQVVPQAMACGLPVICTQNVGSSDLVTNNETGFVIPIQNLQILQEKILYFYENPEEVLRMGTAAKEQVEQGYTWQHYGDKITEFYRQLL